MKSILKVEGAQKLTKNEQKTITGGNAPVCEIGFVAKRCPKVGTEPSYWTCVPNNYGGGCE